uniref:Gustatory receptor n=1 Tax=Tetranychus urticae TaxID=32264 RepID=T1KW38_TETUR
MDRIKNFFSLIADRFPSQFKSLINKIFGLLDDENVDDYTETANRLQDLENIALWLYITRRGHDQDKREIVQSGYHLMNNLIRISAIILCTRLFILCYETSDEMQIYLANPFYKLQGAQAIAFMISSLVFTLSLLREYIMYLEDIGSSILLTYLRDIRQYGFDCKRLGLTEKQRKKFRVAFHLILVNWYRIIQFNIYIIPAFIAIVHLVNPAFGLDNPTLIITSFFWFLSESFCFIYVACGTFDIGAHITVLVPLFIFKIESIIELNERYLFSPKSIEPHLLRQLNIDTIRLLNLLDVMSRDLRYLFVFVIVGISFLADTFIFLGPILHIGSTILQNFFSTLGFFILFAIGLISYAAGNLHGRLIIIHKRYTSLLAKEKVDFGTHSKAMEVLDRIMGPFTGVKIGDFCTIDRYLFVVYIMENASMIMLLVCNAQSYINY